MTSIIDISKTPNKVEFKIKNKGDFEIALINALRRIILVNLSSINIDRDSVIFFENSSVFCDDFLNHRLSLLPLNVEELDKMDFNNIMITCDVKNEGTEILNVYPKDFNVMIEEKEIPLNKVFILDNVIFCRLKTGQKVSFSSTLKKGTSKTESASFSLASKVSYMFEKDEKMIKEQLSQLKTEEEKNEFLLLNQERCYARNLDGSPSLYKFMIEGDGMVPTKSLFKMGCDYLTNLLNEKIEILKNPDSSEEIEIEVSKTNMTAFDIIFKDSDDTLGNLIQTYGMKEKGISYIGYRILHPLDRILNIRVSLDKKDFSEKDVCQKIIDILKTVLTKVSTLRKDYG